MTHNPYDNLITKGASKNKGPSDIMRQAKRNYKLSEGYVVKRTTGERVAHCYIYDIRIHPKWVYLILYHDRWPDSRDVLKRCVYDYHVESKTGWMPFDKATIDAQIIRIREHITTLELRDKFTIESNHIYTRASQTPYPAMYLQTGRLVVRPRVNGLRHTLSARLVAYILHFNEYPEYSEISDDWNGIGERTFPLMLDSKAKM